MIIMLRENLEREVHIWVHAEMERFSGNGFLMQKGKDKWFGAQDLEFLKFLFESQVYY